jgi:hypothetical protein
MAERSFRCCEGNIERSTESRIASELNADDADFNGEWGEQEENQIGESRKKRTSL